MTNRIFTLAILCSLASCSGGGNDRARSDGGDAPVDGPGTGGSGGSWSSGTSGRGGFGPTCPEPVADAGHQCDGSGAAVACALPRYAGPLWQSGDAVFLVVDAVLVRFTGSETTPVLNLAAGEVVKLVDEPYAYVFGADGQLARRRLDGTGTPAALVACAIAPQYSGTVIADATSVYWSTVPTGIARFPKAATPSARFGQLSRYGGRLMAVDDRSFYVAESNGVVVVPKTDTGCSCTCPSAASGSGQGGQGGNVAPSAACQASDGTMSNGGAGGWTDSFVRDCTHDGTPLNGELALQDSRAIAVDADAVYIADTYRLWRATKDGQSVTTLLGTQPSGGAPAPHPDLVPFGAFALDGPFVYARVSVTDPTFQSSKWQSIRMRKDGSDLVVLEESTAADPAKAAVSIVATTDAAYYLLQYDCTTELRRYPKSGGPGDGGARSPDGGADAATADAGSADAPMSDNPPGS